MATAISGTADACASEFPVLINRKAASKYLREKFSVRVSPAWLSRLASMGEGPNYIRIGRSAVYSVQALDAWIEAKAKPVPGLSEGGADAAH